MIEEVFNQKFNKAKFLWFWDKENAQIVKVRNRQSREVYDDMRWRILYFFSLTEAKRYIKQCDNIRTPDGHANQNTPLEEYKIIKSVRGEK